MLFIYIWSKRKKGIYTWFSPYGLSPFFYTLKKKKKKNYYNKQKQNSLQLKAYSMVYLPHKKRRKRLQV